MPKKPNPFVLVNALGFFPKVVGIQSVSGKKNLKKYSAIQKWVLRHKKNIRELSARMEVPSCFMAQVGSLWPILTLRNLHPFILVRSIFRYCSRLKPMFLRANMLPCFCQCPSSQKFFVTADSLYTCFFCSWHGTLRAKKGHKNSNNV